MRAMAFALLLLAGACDIKAANFEWDLSAPFTLLVEAAPYFGTGQISPSFGAAIEELGGTIDDSGTQVIHVRYSADCACSSCSGDTLGYVNHGYPDVINLCPGVVGSPPYTLGRVVQHEIGHALGLRVHLGPHNIMVGDIDQATTNDAHMAPLSGYTSEDRAAICGAGVLKGKCNAG